MTPCPDCHYLQEERLAIAHDAGRMPYADALKLAQAERCPAHRPAEKISQLAFAMREALDSPDYQQPK